MRRGKDESFAESFRLFYQKPKELREASPNTFSFIRSSVRKFERKAEKVPFVRYHKSDTLWDVSKNEIRAVEKACKSVRLAEKNRHGRKVSRIDYIRIWSGIGTAARLSRFDVSESRAAKKRDEVDYRLCL